jgi:GH43 family beta-xylosidase
VKSPDGREDWIVYHAARHPGAGWNRDVRLQRLGWTKDGTPDFGVPVPPGVPLALPSGTRL